MHDQIYYYAIKYQGDYNKITQAIKNNEPYQMIQKQQPCITRGDSKYPSCLLELEKPPWILFYEGNLGLLQKVKVAMVGSRAVTLYGEQCAIYAARALSQTVIVSGMAKGVDTFAHQYAKHTIGVVAQGLDVHYPKENHALYLYMKNRQLLLSEYPHGVKPKKYHFPFRNRIIAALAEVLIIPSCKINGGTMHTVEEALKLGKMIYAFPHPFNSNLGMGCNVLIEQGANMLYCDEDIEELKKGLTNDSR